MISKNVHHFSEKSSDTWLTPPGLIQALGRFDMDVCCPSVMPWTTAKRMIRFPKEDGLRVRWTGYVWCNPPYSEVLPWVSRMVEHGNGMLLVSAKSPDSRWGQTVLREADLLYYLDKRIQFHHSCGAQSKGKILPNLLAAFGSKAEEKLLSLDQGEWPGVYVRSVK